MLDHCSNLVKVTAPLVEKVGKDAFEGAYNLRHVTLSPDVVVTPEAFIFCLSLEVLAASVGFELETGDRDGDGHNDATVGITRFATWRNQMDDNKVYYKGAMVMLELANTPLNGNVGMRASTEDPIWDFVAGPGRDMANLILFFKLGVKVGKGDLREASKAKLLEVGLELKVLRMEDNRNNMRHWRAVVDSEGKVIEGGIREAVTRGLVTEANHEWTCWGLRKRENGDVYDVYGSYGEKGVVHGRRVDGVAVPV